MYRVALYVNELKQVVISNKETLMQLRTSFDKPDVMVELAKKLENPENVLQRQVNTWLMCKSVRSM